MSDKSIVLAALLAAAWPLGGAPEPELKFVVVVSRHGVRSPTWDNARLNAYSAQAWPEWEVPPGNLTPRGRTLMEIMGSYYRQWFSTERLLQVSGCRDAARVYIRADKDQRTFETGRALSSTLLPGCKVPVDRQPENQSDPLFSGFGSPDPTRMIAAVRERLGSNPQKLLADHRAALDELQAIVNGTPDRQAIGVAQKGRGIELTGPFAVGSTFSENLLLEYADGMEGPRLGWGRVTPENLKRILEVHTVYADLMRRTPFLARARGSNLLSHILCSLEQAASGKPLPGALGHPGDALAVLAGHDTNISNLSGMLGLSWKLAGYQPDDTPPGGALVFSLWREPGTGRYSLSLRYLAQTLDQMHRAEPLSASNPPASQDVLLPGCPAAGSCTWETAREILRRAIDPEFVAVAPPDRVN